MPHASGSAIFRGFAAFVETARALHDESITLDATNQTESDAVKSDAKSEKTLNGYWCGARRVKPTCIKPYVSRVQKHELPIGLIEPSANASGLYFCAAVPKPIGHTEFRPVASEVYVSPKMNSHQNQVRAKYPRAVVQARIDIPRARTVLNQGSYWAIVLPGKHVNTLIGRGETEAAAWAVAALMVCLESVLARGVKSFLPTVD